MKNLAFIFLLLLSTRCSTADVNEDVVKEKTVQISKSGTFEFFLASGIPIEGGFSISQQAEHFLVSEIQSRESGLYYVYVPEENFSGTDVVKILSESSNGAEIYAESTTVLTIKVTK